MSFLIPFVAIILSADVVIVPVFSILSVADKLPSVLSNVPDTFIIACEIVPLFVELPESSRFPVPSIIPVFVKFLILEVKPLFVIVPELLALVVICKLLFTVNTPLFTNSF